MYAGCAYLARDLNSQMQNDNTLKSNIYALFLKCDKIVVGGYATALEREYVKAFYALMLRDAMNNCLKYRETIQWS